MPDESNGDTLFEQLRHYRAFETIVDEVQRRIADRRLTLGQRLPPERELATQFGVSRATLREAFRVLESMGLIESRIGSGRYVVSLASGGSQTDGTLGERALVPFVEFLLGIEPYLAGLAAARATDADLMRISRTLETNEQTRRVAAATDTGFHLAVTEAAHNVVARDVLHSERSVLYWADLWVSVLPFSTAAIAAEHRAVYEAISARDTDRARAAMTMHLSSALERVREAARQRVITTSPIAEPEGGKEERDDPSIAD